MSAPAPTHAGPGGLPPEAFAAALAGLPRMTPRRLAALLRWYPPEQAYAVAVGAAPADPPSRELLAAEGLGAQWRTAGASVSPAAVWDACERNGIGVTVLGSDAYPAVLAADLDPPAVLFHRGDLAALAARRAGVVGTRRCTSAGRLTAVRLGEGLAAEGVAVVSGLARGVDGAAHRGALSQGGAGPIGVVASGLDVVYPREHANLWAAVAEHGVLLGEAPPGTAPEAHRFPLRNRILAAVCEVIVVVESKSTGGSLITVREALRRDVTVLAVPGAPDAAAAGTNQLLQDGALVALDVADVLIALGLDARRAVARLPFDPRPIPPAFDAGVLAALGPAPSTLDDVVARLDAGLGDVALALGRLEASGWVAVTGGWFESLHPRIGPT
ncbi:MAG: DNA-protecting protein DprA [Actinomycetota bacterium]|nr:MAG: DNA-protecting protein DprA [Actinomycetota bacterium]